jgi:hypothetical protein
MHLEEPSRAIQDFPIAQVVGGFGPYDSLGEAPVMVLFQMRLEMLFGQARPDEEDLVGIRD